MSLFAKIINYSFLVSFILKAVFHFLHVRETNNKELKIVFKYLYLIPVLDKYQSIYKMIANIFCFIAICTIIAFLYLNKDGISRILEEWNNIP